MKKIVFLLLLFFINNFCFAADVRFIQVTDVHLTQNNAQYLEQFVDDINNNFNNLDFVVFTGDNINRANKQDLELFLNVIRHLKIKAYVVLGNHDLFDSKGMTKEYYMRMVKNLVCTIAICQIMLLEKEILYLL